MAIKYLRLKDNKTLITCLSSDTKPTAVTGYLLIEEDTGDVFYVSASAWVKNITGGGGSAWGSITGTLSNQTDLNTVLNGKEPLKGSDDNYVTDAEKVVIGNTSGTNTGDNATNTQYSGLAASKQDVLTGLTASVAELNYTDGVTSAIQTQLDNKLDDTQFSGLTKISVGTGTPSSPNSGDLWCDTN